MESVTRSLAWAPPSGPGREETTVILDDNGCTAVGHITGTDPHLFDVYYRIEIDDQWRTRYVLVSETLSGRSVEIRSGGDGRWWSDDGRLLRHLDAAIDVDISATPFSNTLPVRRLGIEVGQSAEIVAAYVDVPAMTVSADPQRYTRLLPDVYRYQSLDSDFTRDVLVDELGFVLEYPGLFSRVPAGLEPV
ncbi:putative glycolipid-binding domain-containing protein [Herbiconiux sp. UC225_62]|uniref:putative glycolipid-binding domain-containing protein n=1 Tax=Herbiconiux sp. UC225_62 TaxID=3350168 RepID=UPI0036D28617